MPGVEPSIVASVKLLTFYASGCILAVIWGVRFLKSRRWLCCLLVVNKYLEFFTEPPVSVWAKVEMFKAYQVATVQRVSVGWTWLLSSWLALTICRQCSWCKKADSHKLCSERDLRLLFVIYHNLMGRKVESSSIFLLVWWWWWNLGLGICEVRDDSFWHSCFVLLCIRYPDAFWMGWFGRW